VAAFGELRTSLRRGLPGLRILLLAREILGDCLPRLLKLMGLFQHGLWLLLLILERGRLSYV